MSHSKIEPNLQSTSQTTMTRSLGLEKVALVFEHSLTRIEEQTIQDLQRLFDPQTTEISVVHVLPEQMPDSSFTANDAILLSQYLQEREQYQQSAISVLREHLKKSGYTVQHEYTCSIREHNLQPLIEQIHASQKDLIVICRSHLQDDNKVSNHFFIALTTHASVPVLVLKKYFASNRSNLHLLFGVDDSESSMLAAHKLGSLIPAKQTELTLATVQSPIYQENAILAPFVNQDILDQSLANNAKMIFEIIGDVLQAEGIAVQNSKTLIGSPATELAYLAELNNPDLVVVGSHNRTGMMAWLMGSVSSQLLHWDVHNILIIR
jgi:nucleotide-binding universal stress UspA family protein